MKRVPLITELSRRLPQFWLKRVPRKIKYAFQLNKCNRLSTRFKKYLKSTALTKKIVQRNKKVSVVLQKQATLALNRIKRKYQKLALYFLVVDHLYYMHVDYVNAYYSVV